MKACCSCLRVLGFPGTREGTQIGNRVPRVTGKMQA